MRWVYQWDYRSSYGAGQRGDVVELSEAEAAAINRDSPGVLVPEGETRSVEAPPSDRMQRRARERAVSA